jgi:hypothetical protein
MGNVVEYQVISHQLDRPTHGDDYFHEERDLQLNFEALNNRWRIRGIGQSETKSVLAG